jgi:putative redox protein
MSARLEWDGELQFTGFIGKHEVPIDGVSEAAPSPMQMLALSLAGCMAIDLVHILARGRHDCVSLEASLVADRAQENPKRFTRVRLHFKLSGPMKPEHVDRAIQLSREKYCSVWTSLRQDIELEVGYDIS